MTRSKLTRFARNVVVVAGVAAFASATGIITAEAQQKTVKLGITLPLTGADADGALKIKHGFQMAIDEANASGGVAGCEDRDRGL